MTFNDLIEYSIFLSENLNFTGTCTVLYKNGKKEYEHNYVNGKQHGKQYYWYQSGQKSYEDNFVNGLQIGIQMKEEKAYEIKPEENSVWYLIVKEFL